MTTRGYYKIGSLVLGLMCFALMFLMLGGYQRSENANPGTDVVSDFKVYRQLLTEMGNSKNPEISQDFRNKCLKEANHITDLLTQYQQGQVTELTMRKELNNVSTDLLNDPILASTKRNSKTVNYRT